MPPLELKNEDYLQAMAYAMTGLIASSSRIGQGKVLLEL